MKLKFETVSDLFKAFLKAPSEELESLITKAVLKTEWHSAMTGNDLDTMPTGKVYRFKKDIVINNICMPIDDDEKKAAPFFENSKDLLKWVKTIKDNPDYVVEGELIHDIVTKGKDMDPSGYSRDVKAFIFYPKGAKNALTVYRKDLKYIFIKK